MKDYQKLIKLLYKRETCNTIAGRLNISNKQLYNKILALSNKGFNLNKKYFSNGQIVYKIPEEYDERKISENIIYSLQEEYDIKMLLISDLHFGNELERPDLVDRAFEYCTKNDIHIILCAGDMIDCCFSKSKKQYSTVDAQISHFIKKYPHDKNILTFAVAGNHDYLAYLKEAKSLIKAVNNYRHDIIIGGFANSTVAIKNEKIDLYHHIDSIPRKTTDSVLTLHGHAHKYVTELKENGGLDIVVPSLSNLSDTLPTALEMNLYFRFGKVEKVDLKQIYFDNTDIILSEGNYDLSIHRSIKKGNRANVIGKENDIERAKVYGLSMK